MATVEVTCLGLCPSSSCLLIDVQPGPRILLDCPLEPQGLKFFPVAYGSGNVRVNGAASTSGLLHTAQLGAVDPSTVDYVVITTSHNMLGLPYFTEGSAKFQGTVIATEPTAEIGKLMMMELTQYISTSSFGSSGMSEGGEGEWYKGPGSVEMGPGRDPYTAQQVESCMSRVKRLNFGQSLALSEGYAITPYPSGYCLGSSFWLLSKPQCKVALIGACSMGFPLRTPLPPRFDSLRNVNVAIFGDLLPSDRLVTPAGMSVTQPPPPAWPFRDIGQAIQNTLQKGGNVLMPITLGGTSLDLLEALSMWCPDFGVSGMNAPIYLISPTANSLIGYLEILSEWVQTFDATRREREGRIDSPFVHQSMLQNSRLHIISDVHDLRSSSSSTTTTNMPTQPPTSTYREPCLVLAGHPSLRFGPCLHFLKRWGAEGRERSDSHGQSLE
uniref:Beta-Casp domain-containing protein n=1 Tax=Guillardia theta TaxID=55529 RepID=A0A7S4KXN2_GUITH|mmetsp:Transcript_32684/g.103459  ORF Transcript_32684/g.103459 Transcript_32684/m.103459 type:complete len:441 (+) Transcript_32684:243-1565(+)